MRAALIRSGSVVNIVEHDPDALWSPPTGHELVALGSSSQVAIGWLFDGVDFHEPAPTPTVPTSVTMRQARLALLAAGKLDSVDAAIASIADASARRAAQIAWEFSSEVQRANGLVAQLAPALGLDDAAIDALFLDAATR